MKSKIILIMIIVMLLSGCGKGDTSKKVVPTANITTDVIQLLVSNTSVFNLNVPANMELVYTDNSTYYEYSNGIKVMSMHTKAHATEKYNESLDVYYTKSEVSRDIGDGSISILCTEDSVDLYKKLLSSGTVIQIVDAFDKSKRIDVLSDSYVNKASSMKITENGNYMPTGVIESLDSTYTADLVTQGSKWCKSWIQDGNLEDIQTLLNCYVYCTDGTANVEFWYKTDEQNLLYLRTANAVIAAKALRLNAWTIYYASTDYEDYVRTALDMVHAK